MLSSAWRSATRSAGMENEDGKAEETAAAGWKIGNAEEFLELSEAEAAYIAMKLSVGQQIRELRKANAMTQAELAKRVRSSQSRIAKMETGDPAFRWICSFARCWLWVRLRTRLRNTSCIDAHPDIYLRLTPACNGFAVCHTACVDAAELR